MLKKKVFENFKTSNYQLDMKSSYVCLDTFMCHTKIELRILILYILSILTPKYTSNKSYNLSKINSLCKQLLYAGMDDI